MPVRYSISVRTDGGRTANFETQKRGATANLMYRLNSDKKSETFYVVAGRTFLKGQYSETGEAISQTGFCFPLRTHSLYSEIPTQPDELCTLILSLWCPNLQASLCLWSACSLPLFLSLSLLRSSWIMACLDDLLKLYVSTNEHMFKLIRFACEQDEVIGTNWIYSRMVNVTRFQFKRTRTVRSFMESFQPSTVNVQNALFPGIANEKRGMILRRRHPFLIRP